MPSTVLKSLVLISISFSSAAVMGTELVQAQVEDHYRSQVRQVPKEERVCRDVVVEDRSSNSGAIVLGAIVGNALGAASGIEHGRTLGTVIGGVAGNQIGSPQSQQRIEQRCYTQVKYDTYTEQVYSHSTVKFYSHGRWHTVQFRK